MFAAYKLSKFDTPQTFNKINNVSWLFNIVKPLTLKLFKVFIELPYKIPLMFKLLMYVVLFDSVVYPLTFNDDRYVIGCVDCLTTTNGDEPQMRWMLYYMVCPAILIPKSP